MLIDRSSIDRVRELYLISLTTTNSFLPVIKALDYIHRTTANASEKDCPCIAHTTFGGQLRSDVQVSNVCFSMCEIALTVVCSANNVQTCQQVKTLS